MDKRRWGSWVRAICSGFALLGLSSGAARAQSVTEFNITGGATPTSITAGPDGNLWFTEEIANRIGRITPLGVVTEAAATLFTLPARFPVLAFQAGTIRANNALLLFAPDGSGTLSFSNDLPSGTVRLIVDVNGWWQ